MRRLFPILLSICFISLALIEAKAEEVWVATFDVDATPPVGSMMAYDEVHHHNELTIRFRGIVITGIEKPIVMGAIDWIGVSNEAQDVFRDALADAAGTDRQHVAVHALHQHDAPGADFTAEKIVKELGLEGYARLQSDFARVVIKRAADAIRDALPDAQPVTHYGWGEVEVEKIASNRRMLEEDGTFREMRWTRTTDPRLRAEPEGVIDPEVSLLSFWNEDQPVAVLSYYACHPQSYYRTGVPSPDFPGIARFIRGQGQPAALHVHFNGAGGNIGAGKYNDGDTENRMVLADRLAQGMRKAWTTTLKHPLTADDIGWAIEPVRLEPADHIDEEKLLELLNSGQAEDAFLTEVDKLAWLRRYNEGHAIDISCLSVGKARVLNMPGELFVEYQLAAKAMRPDLDVAMAAYGEYGPGYIGTAIAYEEGGYETSDRASNVGPEAEAILTEAMEKLLGQVPEENDFRIPPRSVEDAIQSFEVAEGFEMQLVAAEPNVVEPILISYDENGQMYVAEYLKFPSKGGVSYRPDGRIRMLRDLDGDGHYEWSQVFANNIEWPTGILPWKGGVYVVAAPDLWYFKDTDGDGEAEVREKLFTGFGFRNDEGTANNLIWGLDNWIYGAGSNSSGDIRPVNDPDAKPLSLRNRDFRFHPETLEFQTISGSQQYGNSIDDWGNRFICENSKPAVQVVLPSHYLERNPYLPVSNLLAEIWEGDDVYRISPPEPWRKARTKVRLASDRVYAAPFVAHDVFTGTTGVTIYRGDAYPDSTKGNLFVGDVQSNIVHRRVLEKDGAIFKAVRVDKETEFVRSSDNWFRPTNFSNAPDGTLHISDMYREFIETPDSLPDDIYAKTDFSSGENYGRIYRLAPKGFKAPPPPQLGKASISEWVSTLENPNSWWRETASRLIYQSQDTSAVPLLRELLKTSKSELARLHALYALEGFKAVEANDIEKALRDKSSGVRKHAIVLAESHLQSHSGILKRVMQLTKDSDPHVRFQAAFSLGSVDDSKVAATLAGIAQRDVEDIWIRTAVLSAVPEMAIKILEVAAGQSKQSPEFLRLLLQVVGARNQEEEIQKALTLISDADRSKTRSMVLALGEGQLRAQTNLSRVAQSDPTTGKLIEELIEGAIETLSSSAENESRRRQAVNTLAHGVYETVSEPLTQLLSASESSTIQLSALAVLSGFGMDETGSALIEAFPKQSPQVRSETIETLLSRESWTRELLEAVEANQIVRGEITSVRQDLLKEHPSADIKTHAIKLFGQGASSRDAVIDDYRSALDLVGDKERGRSIFEQQCMVCHRLGTKGLRVGPDMATIQNRTAESLLVQILDPNRDVLASYTQYFIELLDGSLVSGRIESESPASITLQRAGGAEETILRQNISSIKASNRSLMPEGLEHAIDKQQMRDLIALLLDE